MTFTTTMALAVGLATGSPGCRTGVRCSHVITVGGGGGFDCPTVQSAVECAPASGAGAAGAFRVRILVSPGVYKERVTVSKPGIALLGQAPGPDAAGEPSGANPSTSAVVLTWPVPNVAVLTVAAGGDDFVLANMTVYDDANRFQVGKNFALYLAGGDRAAVFYSAFFGAQDTVYTGSSRVYFNGVVVNGTTDFNYGSGRAVYDGCTLVGSPGAIYGGESFLTAASGGNVSANSSTPADPESRNTMLIINSRLPAAPRSKRTYLGRPWGRGATVVYSSVWMDAHIAPAGWYPWWTQCSATNASCADTFFAEFNSTGPGGASAAGARVKWSRQLTATVAAQWTTGRVLRGWTPPDPQLVWG